ncbi:MAG: CHAT domain-containing protein [Planctomycetota bacterium]
MLLIALAWLGTTVAHRDSNEAAVAPAADAPSAAHELAALNAWIDDHAAPNAVPTAAEVEAVRDRLVVLLQSLEAERGAVDALQARWLDWLESAPSEAVSDALFAEAVQWRIWFSAYHAPPETLVRSVGPTALARLRATGEPTRVVYVEAMRADALRVEGRLNEALDALEAADLALEEGPCAPSIAALLLSVAVKAEIDLGRLDRVGEHVDAAIELERSHPDDLDVALCRRLAEVRLAHASNRPRQLDARVADLEHALVRVDRTDARAVRALATAYALRAIGTARAAGSPEEMRAALAGVEASLAERGDTAARRADRLSLELERARLEQALGGDARPAVERLLADLARLSSPLARARVAAEVHAFARRIEDAPAREHAREHLLEAARASMRVWAEIDSGPGGVGFLQHAGRRFVLAELIESELDGNGGAAGALERLIEFDPCHTTAQRLGHLRASAGLRTDAVDLATLAAVVKDADAQLLVLAPSGAWTDLFVVNGPEAVRHARFDAGSPEHEALGQGAQGGGALRAYARWLAQAPARRAERRDDPTGPARALGDALLATLARDGSDERPLWVVGWEPRPFVPLASLPTGTGPPLGLRFPLVHSATCSELVWSDEPARQARGQTDDPFVLFSLAGDAQRGEIKLSNREAADLLRAAGANAQHIAGRNATPQRFAGALACGADVLALWTHGDFTAGERWPARLLLERAGNGSGSVDAGELADALEGVPLQRVPRVVFLATCGADRGHRRAGDPIAGRTTGVLLASGIGSVVAARGELHRNATATLLTEFTRQHRSLGADTARALLEARRAVARDERFDDPHYWGPLSLYGR